MRQQSFATDDFEKYRKKTRKEVFLEEMAPFHVFSIHRSTSSSSTSSGTAPLVSTTL